MSLSSIRNLSNQWFPPAPLFTEDSIPPQNGTVFIVTGGNTGVGYALVKILYGTGAKIYMASRNKEKAAKAIEILESSTPVSSNPGTLHFLPLDLSSLPSIQNAATIFASLETKLDVLFNNAGAGPGNTTIGSRTEQDLDPMIGTNCVGTLMLSVLLVPMLRCAGTGGERLGEERRVGRVVWTSSYLAEGASPKNGVDLNLLDAGVRGQSEVKNYAMSKAGTWILGQEFATRYPDIISVIQNPGNLRAGGYDNVSGLTMFFISPLLHEPKFGGYTELYAGLSPSITLSNNGAYVIPWGRIRLDDACPRKDILNAMKSEGDGGLGYGQKLWEWCEEKWAPFM